MQSTIISLTISFIDNIQQSNVMDYISYLTRVSKEISKKYNINIPQLLSFPISDNQPDEIPFAFMSNEQLFSASISKKSLVFTLKYDGLLEASEIVNKINDAQSILFRKERTNICGNRFKTISLSITADRKMNSYKELLSFARIIQEKYYMFGINDNGFSLKFTENSNSDSYTAETISYNTTCNIKNKQLGIAINKEYILGGIRCSNFSFIDITNKDIEAFFDYVGSVNMSNQIKETYGLSAEQ